MATSFQHALLAQAAARLEMPLRSEGDPSLLDRPRRALLVSRTEKKIAPGAPWLLALRAATERALGANEALVCGVGRVPYEAPLWLAKISNGAAIVVLSGTAERAALDEAILPQRRLLVWPEAPSKKGLSPALRDRLLGALADRATAVYVRAGGNMAALAAEIAACGGKVDAVYSAIAAAAPRRILRPAQALKAPATPTASTAQTVQWEFEGWLSHFTREPDGAYPGEPPAEYLAWLCSGENATPRDACGSLCRILSERMLRASRRLMPGRVEMACFTALPPHEALRLRRWRRGLRRWSFTPYGIAVEKESLYRMGARPVQYFKANEKFPTGFDVRFAQRCGAEELDWSREQEWRIPGNVRLESLPPEKIRIITATSDEAARIGSQFGLPAFALCGR